MLVTDSKQQTDDLAVLRALQNITFVLRLVLEDSSGGHQNHKDSSSGEQKYPQYGDGQSKTTEEDMVHDYVVK